MKKTVLRSTYLKRLLKVGKGITISFGIVFLFLLAISFTSAPYYMLRKLSMHQVRPPGEFDYIVVMGGSGMPSKSALIRSYYARELYKRDSSALLVLALTGDKNKEHSAVLKMKNDLVLRGIPNSKIIIESIGNNTREQVLFTKECVPGIEKANTVIVTSPSHMKRSYNSFLKAGFSNVSCFATIDVPNEANLEYNTDSLGGRKIPMPDIGKNINLRYRFWIHLEYEIQIAREYLALGYYRLKGWI
jgi:uncharacterized SAM-binding protein YcdF (DUF218 family)